METRLEFSHMKEEEEKKFIGYFSTLFLESRALKMCPRKKARNTIGWGGE